MTHDEMETIAELHSSYTKSLNDEIADLKRQLADAAQTIDHWRVKSKCYGGIVHGCTPALEAAGFPVDKSTADGAIGGIRRAVEAMTKALTASREREEALREGLAAIGLAAGEQKRRGEPMIHDAIIDVVKFTLRETAESEASDATD